MDAQKIVFQYGWANGSFTIKRDKHMLFVETDLGTSQINCQNEDEALMLYTSICQNPVLVDHLNWIHWHDAVLYEVGDSC